jgi:hypothetical protein
LELAKQVDELGVPADGFPSNGRLTARTALLTPDQAKRLAQELVVNDHVDVRAGFVITLKGI